MPVYEVDILRIGYGCKTIRVEAKDPDAAEEIALGEAGKHTFRETESEYQVETDPREVIPMPED